VNLAAAAGIDAFGWGKFFTAGSRQVQFGPAIHLPIFDAGAPRSQLKSRYADFDLDVANYNQTLINALSDVATQIATIRSIDQQSGDAQQVLNASTKAYKLAVICYKAGLSEQLQVLSADQHHVAAEQTVTNLKTRRRDMQIGLIKALGGGIDATQTGLVVRKLNCCSRRLARCSRRRCALTNSRDLSSNPGGALRFCCSPSLALNFIPPVVACYLKQYPQVKVKFHTALLADIADELLTRKLELAISGLPLDHPNLVVEPFAAGRMVCMRAARTSARFVG
jgi:hypothetical protein